MRVFKRITDKAIPIIITIALCLALVLCTFAFSRTTVHAEDDTPDYYDPTDAGISNTNFSDSSGSYPATPSSWTGSNVGGGSGTAVSGVVDLSPETYVGNETLKLEDYPEYSSKEKLPKTIFANNRNYPNADAKTLLINAADGSELSYAYTSTSMNFAKNAYYRVSAWVKTGDFPASTGATIKLNGLGVYCGFNNINTVAKITERDDTGAPVLTEDNNYGWVKYTIYVRTSPAVSSTVTLSLGLGDATTGSDEDPDLSLVPLNPVKNGYAFFDTVSAQRISAHDYAFETGAFEPTDRDGVHVYESDTDMAMAIDLYNTSFLTVDKGGVTTEIGSFSSNTELWNMNALFDPENADSDINFSGVATASIFDSLGNIDPENNVYGFSKNPRSPLGKAEDKNSVGNTHFNGGTNGNILMISTYDGSKFVSGAGGVASPDITIERFGYYRLGVWVKADTIRGGAGITIGVRGESNIPADDYKLNKWYNNLDSNGDSASFGWKEQIVYIKGSAAKDLTVHFELWLGSPTSQSQGIAMFDNVTFTKLTYSEYSTMSSADSGSILALDTPAADTGVSNGTFADVGKFDELEYPLPIADWTFQTPDISNTIGFSKTKVNTDNIKYGLLPVDPETFDIAAKELYSVINPTSFAYPATGNVMLLSSETPTAFCYKSANITASTDKAYMLTVDMAVDKVTEGYGASLMLKTSGGTVVSTIENITTTNNAFKTFTFYIDAPLSDQTLNVEIWLGLADRKGNTLKLSNGNIYVKKVAMTEWPAPSGSTASAEYAKMLDRYIEDISNAAFAPLDYGVYSFTTPSLNYYDIYTYNMLGSYMPLYQWNVTSSNGNVISGVFNTDNMHGLVPYDGFEKRDQTGNMMFIYNTAPNHTVFTYGNTLSLVSNMFYRLDVTLKLRLPDDMLNSDIASGLKLSITGSTTASFDNIKDTTEYIVAGNEEAHDRETWQTYSFYISTGSDGGDLGISMVLGGEDKRNYIQGQLIISDISLTSITNTEYDNASEGDKVKKVALSDPAETEEETKPAEVKKGEVAVWIIPTIILSVCLFAAIIIILVVRLRDRIKKNKKTVYASEYDRSAAAKDIERLAKSADEDAERKASPEPEDTTEPGEPDDFGEIAAKPEPEQKPAKPQKREPDESDDLED